LSNLIKSDSLLTQIGDRQSTGDVKAIEKGRALLESDRILATSFVQKDEALFFTGIVGAAMKTRVGSI
jgi:hypothetical protein